MTGPLAAEAGVTYLEEGTYTFTLANGARFTIYISPYSPEFCDWAFPYKRNENRYSEADEVAKGVKSIAKHPISANVDIVKTHGPPKDTLDTCPQGNVGCPRILQAVQRVRPLMHCFGHIHEGNGAMVQNWDGEHLQQTNTGTDSGNRLDNSYPQAIDCSIRRSEQTLMVNAAIMDAKNQPVNKLWIVDLELTAEK